jgi:hypothetical protein
LNESHFIGDPYLTNEVQIAFATSTSLAVRNSVCNLPSVAVENGACEMRDSDIDSEEKNNEGKKKIENCWKRKRAFAYPVAREGRCPDKLLRIRSKKTRGDSTSTQFKEAYRIPLSLRTLFTTAVLPVAPLRAKKNGGNVARATPWVRFRVETEAHQRLQHMRFSLRNARSLAAKWADVDNQLDGQIGT